MRPRQPAERRSQRGRAARQLVLNVLEGQQQADEGGPSLAGWERVLLLVPERQHAETVSMSCGDVTERQSDALRDVGLAPIRGAERHRHRRVEDDPADEHALGEVHADVRLPRPGGDVPVNVADVVLAGHVGANLGQLGAAAEHVRPVVAREQPFDATHDGQVERPQQLVRKRPRAGLLRRALYDAPGGAAHATRSLPRSS